jgi:hypothetical protein
MATTTNYGWTTPDDTALVKDGASAIRSLGTSVDTTTKNLNPSTTLGDIEYRSSTANTNTRLAIGTTGQILTVAGGVPTWAAPAGGGKVLQVVQGTTTTGTSIATTTFTDTTLTASITPSSASSKVLILYSQQYKLFRGASTMGSGLQLLRGATSIQGYGTGGKYAAFAWGGAGDTGGAEGRIVISGNYLDTPATTSSTTYKIQLACETTANSGSIYAQEDSSVSTIILMEIGA